jgi:hypothetical protein
MPQDEAVEQLSAKWSFYKKLDLSFMFSDAFINEIFDIIL